MEKELKIKYIEIGFENCEEAKLYPDMFSGLIINGIKREYSINCYQYKDGRVLSSFKCEEFEVTINNMGLKSKLLIHQINRTLESRLLSKDIVSVYLFFNNGKSEHIYVPWGKKDYDNEKQKHRAFDDKLGIRLRIRIKD